MRRKDKERDSDFAMNVLKQCEYATVAMVDLYGEPYCVPVSPAIVDGAIYFHCAMEGTKTDILRSHPDVCVCGVMGVRPYAPDFTTEYSSAIARGRAIEVIDDAEKIEALRAICERYAAENMAEFDAAIKRSLKRTAIWKIEIESITGKQKEVKRS